jgi:hypothetical protein
VSGSRLQGRRNPTLRDLLVALVIIIAIVYALLLVGMWTYQPTGTDQGRLNEVPVASQ